MSNAACLDSRAASLRATPSASLRPSPAVRVRCFCRLLRALQKPPRVLFVLRCRWPSRFLVEVHFNFSSISSSCRPAVLAGRSYLLRDFQASRHNLLSRTALKPYFHGRSLRREATAFSSLRQWCLEGPGAMAPTSDSRDPPPSPHSEASNGRPADQES